MKEDAADLVRKCDSCQRHANIQRQPASELSQLSAPWPFAQWGMDILGPFPPASGQRKFLVVAVNYFTKWVEAEPLARIAEANIKNFFWKSVVCHFGVPHTLVTDNGRQFDNQAFHEFCTELGIRHRFTSVGHPQSNGEAEVTNRTILQGLRARLDGSKGRWADELPAVLWAYRTTPRVPTGETPFGLAFGSEAVIPIELEHRTFRTTYYDEASNSDRLRANLDLIEEFHDGANLRMATYRQRVARYYNSKVKTKTFKPGDLVLRRSEVSRPLEQGKLSPNWEGPYEVTEALHRGAYKLKDLEGNLIPRMWNAENLRMYYQ